MIYEEDFIQISRYVRDTAKITKEIINTDDVKILDSQRYTAAPFAPENFSVSNVTETTADVSWDDLLAPLTYEDFTVYVKNVTTDTVEQQITGLTGTSTTVFGLTTGDSYELWVVAVRNGIESDDSPRIPTNPVDVTAPAAPTGLAILQAQNKEIDLSWDANAESDLAGYNVYIDSGGGFSKENSSVITGTTYTISGLTNGQSYDVKITAEDIWGNESSFSSTVSDTVVDNQAPAVPTGLQVDSFTDTTIDLSWDANTEPDLDGYYVYVDGSKVNAGALVNGETFQITGLTQNIQYDIYITAVDDSGNESNSTSTIQQTTQNNAPAAPTGLSGSSNDQQVDLTWDANTEHDLDGHNVYVDGVKDNTTPVSGESYSVTGLTNDQSYDFKITAVDTLGSESAFSSTVSVTPTSFAYNSWSYKKQVTITGQPGAGTDFQVPLLIGASSAATGYDFHVEGNSVSFPTTKNESGDLRFSNNAGDTVLPFWVEKVTGTGASAVAKVWVKIGANLDTNQSIYCYYGKTAPSNASSGDDTFIFFDDFPGSSLDTGKWTVEVGSPTVSGDELDMGGNRIITNSTYPESTKVVGKFRYEGATEPGIQLIKSSNGGLHTAFMYSNVRHYIRTDSDATSREQIYNSVAFNDGDTLYLDISFTPDSDANFDSVLYNSNFTPISTHSDYTKNGVDATPGNIALNSAYNPSGGDCYCDWIFLKKYNSTDPAFSSAGAQQAV